MDRIEFRHDAAATHDLDLRRPGLEVLPRRHQGLVDAVGQDRAAGLEVGRSADEGRVGIVRRPGVTVAGGLGNNCTRREQAWSIDQAGFYRTCKVRMCTTRVADGREARVEVVPGHRGGIRAGDGGVVFLHAARVLAGEMRVQVDEPGGEHAVAAVDDAGALRCFDAIFRHGIDDAFDDKDVARIKFVVDAVENSNVLDQYRLREGGSRNKAEKSGHCNANHGSP